MPARHTTRTRVSLRTSRARRAAERLEQRLTDGPERLRAPLVVEDGVWPVKTPAREALLVAQLALRAAQRQVVLLRQLAERQPVQHSALLGCRQLLPFDALEQGAEVAGPEALVPLALDDLV